MFDILEIVKYLGLKKPFDIQIKSRKHKNMDAAYWALNRKGKLVSHLIRVYTGNDSARSLECLIAHELIHAWQEENNILEIHGTKFIKMAEKIEYKFGISNIYIPGVDKD